MTTKKKQNQPLADQESPLCKEIYLKATKPVTCDGCGETSAIGKGMTYMQHLTEHGNRMNLCPRCIFAVKFRQVSTREPFEIHPGDLQFDKLPNRYQSAWMRLRQRLTKDIHNGAKPNDAWHSACEKLIDELGMRHIYERDCMLAAQAAKFAAIRKGIEKEVAAVKKQIKAVKEEINAAIMAMAKARLELKVAIQKHGWLADADEAMEELVVAITNIREAWEKI